MSYWADLAGIVEAVFVIASIGFIWYELRQSRKLTQAANVQAIVDLTSPFTLQLIQDKRITELWYEGATYFDKMEKVDQYRYKELLTWWLILHENLFYQQRNGLMDKTIYSGWNRDLHNFIARKKLGKHWEGMKSEYQKEFVQHVNTIIAEQEAKKEV